MKNQKVITSRVSRRDFIRNTSIGLVGTGLLSNVGLAKADQSAIELNFLFGPDDSGTIKRLISDFNRQYEGEIKVNWIEMDRLSDNFYRQLTSEFTVESTSIDVIGADIPWTAAFAKKK